MLVISVTKVGGAVPRCPVVGSGTSVVVSVVAEMAVHHEDADVVAVVGITSVGVTIKSFQLCNLNICSSLVFEILPIYSDDYLVNIENCLC